VEVKVIVRTKKEGKQTQNKKKTKKKEKAFSIPKDFVPPLDLPSFYFRNTRQGGRRHEALFDYCGFLYFFNNSSGVECLVLLL
jgi:hypothetical protein